jgi:hypothetical protein
MMAGPTDTTRTQRAAARPTLLAELVAAGTLPCPRCHQPMHPWQHLDVGHTIDVADGGTHSPLRLEHRHCNRQAARQRSLRKITTTPTPPNINSREW